MLANLVQQMVVEKLPGLFFIKRIDDTKSLANWKTVMYDSAVRLA
jgi:hypothetical protein